MQPIANPHSPAELTQLSTAIHNIAGWLFLALSIVLLVETTRGEPRGRGRYVWPAIGGVIGFGLTVYVFLHQWLYHQVSPVSDPLQNQHQLIGLAIGVGSAIELVRRRLGRTGRRWRAAWPLAIIAVGVAFLIHEQGTVDALLVHWALAGTLILAGMGLLAVVIADERKSALHVFAILLLIGASAQLVRYREAPGAHTSHSPSTAPAAHPGH